MKFRVKIIGWSAGRPVAILHKKTAEKLSLHVEDRILIKKNNKKIITIIDIAKGFLKKEEIVVSSEIAKALNLRKNSILEVSIATKPLSARYINKKLEGRELSKKEIFKIIKDIVNNALTDSEVAYFVSAVYYSGMSMSETINLIRAMASTGKKLNLKIKNTVDKHSIGGIPGNRTTPIIVSICAQAGLIMPKTSSRAITSAAGTADVIETIAKVDFSINEIKKIIRKTNACIVWGGALGMAPSDDKIIHVERFLNIDPEAQLLASIMSKKVAAGSKYVLIDIPFGRGAKVDRKKAIRLKKKFEKIARHFKIKLSCLLTDGSQPIGNGVGPLLEIRDVVSVLQGGGPVDLREKSLVLCSEIFKLTGKTKTVKKAYKLAKEILDSGQAFKKFKQIIKSQKGSLNKLNKLGLRRFGHDVKANKSSKILEIDNKSVNYIARVAGCPTNKSAGLYLWKHVGDKVKKDENLITIYAESKSELREAVKTYNKINPIKLK